MAMYDPERVLMQAASIEQDPRLIEVLVLGALEMVHAAESMAIGAPESAFGWCFYPVSITRSALRELASMPDSEIPKVKGDSVEQKFVNWLNRQAKNRGFEERIHFSLASDLRSSRYGLF
jgi:hypothetical protein